jgi:hypothetical protein
MEEKESLDDNAILPYVTQLPHPAVTPKESAKLK